MAKATRGEAKKQRDSAIAAAVKIQTVYRLLRITYLKFGPTIFCKRNGEPAPFGELLFSRGAGVQQSAQWICVAESAKMTLLCHFVERYWRLKQPDLVIDMATLWHAPHLMDPPTSCTQTPCQTVTAPS